MAGFCGRPTGCGMVVREMSSLLIVLLPLVQFGGFSTNRDFSHFDEAAPAGQIHQVDLQLICIFIQFSLYLYIYTSVLKFSPRF